MSLLIGVTLIAVVVNGLLPPRVTFGDPSFTAFPSMDTFWGPVPTTIIVRVPVTNDGIFPIWYKQVSPGDYAAGNLSRTTEVLSISEVDIEWRSLARGDSVQFREYGLERLDQIGIRLVDWTGRKFTVTCEEIEIEPVWLVRESLPVEISD